MELSLDPGTTLVERPRNSRNQVAGHLSRCPTLVCSSPTLAGPTIQIARPVPHCLVLVHQSLGGTNLDLGIALCVYLFCSTRQTRRTRRPLVVHAVDCGTIDCRGGAGLGRIVWPCLWPRGTTLGCHDCHLPALALRVASLLST